MMISLKHVSGRSLLWLVGSVLFVLGLVQPAQARPDVSVSVSPLEVSVPAGDTAGYVVTITNTGTTALHINRVYDDVHGGEETNLLSSFTWPLGRGFLLAGQSVTGTLAYTAPAEVEDIEIVRNTVTATYRWFGRTNSEDSARQTFYVCPPLAVNASVNPDSGTTATPFSFSAYAIYPDNQVVKTGFIRYDFDSDGTYDTPLLPFAIDVSVEIPAEFTHTFSTAGTYTVTIEMQDTFGSVGTDTVSVDVYDCLTVFVGVNVSPSEGPIGTAFTFTIHPVELAPGEQVIKTGYVRWDVDDDGVYDTPWVFFADPDELIVIPHEMIYSSFSSGQHTVTAEVKTLLGCTGTGSAVVTVVE